MEEEIVLTSWEILKEAFPPQALVVILASWVVSFISIRTLWKSLQQKEKDLISVSTKAVEVFDKIELLHDATIVNAEQHLEIIKTLEVLKDRKQNN